MNQSEVLTALEQGLKVWNAQEYYDLVAQRGYAHKWYWKVVDDYLGNPHILEFLENGVIKQNPSIDLFMKPGWELYPY